VTQLCEELDTYQSQVSGSLAVLKRAGLVSSARSGYLNVYRVDARKLDLMSERLRELSRRSQ
jgi:DNA-binding transcriptional ArsR family regulator